MFFNKRKVLNFALESIDFQNDKFGNRIEAIVEDIYKLIETTPGITSTSVQMFPQINELQLLIKSRLGFGAKIKTNVALAAVMPFYGTPYSIFIPKQWQGDIAESFVSNQVDRVLREGKNKATVNTAEATVGGVFADVTVEVFIDFFQLKTVYNCTASETTGIILHELGHAFYGMEYSDRIDGGNQILANLAKVCLNKKKDVDTNYVFRELKAINPKIQKEEIDKMMSSDKTVASYSWFKFVIDVTGTGTGTQAANGKYNSTSFEQLADNFASRFGYGKHVVTGLDKLYKSGWSPEKQRSAWIFFQIMTILAFATAVACVALGLAFGLILEGLLAALIVKCILAGSGEEGRDYTYDKLKMRYMRIRNDLVEALKDPELNKDEVKSVITNIYAVDSIVKDTIEYNTLIDGFLNIFSSSDRNAGKSIREEQLLEELATNMLFVKAAELRLLA